MNTRELGAQPRLPAGGSCFARAVCVAGALLAAAAGGTVSAQCPFSFATRVNYGAGAEPYSVAVADFNADGRPDLAVANFTSNNVSILLGNGNGTFQAAVNYAAGTSPFNECLAGSPGPRTATTPRTTAATVPPSAVATPTERRRLDRRATNRTSSAPRSGGSGPSSMCATTARTSITATTTR